MFQIYSGLGSRFKRLWPRGDPVIKATGAATVCRLCFHHATNETTQTSYLISQYHNTTIMRQKKKEIVKTDAFVSQKFSKHAHLNAVGL